MLPLTPALLLTRKPTFCQQEWDDILSGLELSSTDPWTSILLTGTLAIIDPGQAYARLLAMAPEHMDDGLTRVWALYWAAAISNTAAATTAAPEGGAPVTSTALASGSPHATSAQGAADLLHPCGHTAEPCGGLESPALFTTDCIGG